MSAGLTRRETVQLLQTLGLGSALAHLATPGTLAAEALQARNSPRTPKVVPSRWPRPERATPQPFVDHVQGVEVIDPFRWMEEAVSGDLKRWTDDQQKYVTQVLGESPGIAAVQAALASEFNSLPSVEEVIPIPGGLIVDRWMSSGREFRLLMQGAPERPLFDRNDLKALGRSNQVRSVVPTWDGRLVAVTTTAEGDSATHVSIVDVATGRVLPDFVPDLLTTTGASRYRVTWLPDGSGFFYPRLAAGAFDGPPVERLARSRQYLHRLGTPQSADIPVIGFGLEGGIDFATDDLPTSIITSPGSTWALATVFRVKDNKSELYSAKLDQVVAGRHSWRQISADGFSQPKLSRNTAYAITTSKADRGRIARMDLSARGGSWRTVVRQRRGVLLSFVVASDALYFTEYHRGAVRLLRQRHGMARADAVGVPAKSGLQFAPHNPCRDTPWVKVQTWTDPGNWFRVDPGAAAAVAGKVDIGGSPTNQQQFHTRNILVEVDDGARVPVSLVHLSGQRPNPDTPLLLEAYGGYGRIQAPSYNPSIATWVRQGAVYAYAHVRGGGEMGASWRAAALQDRKIRSSQDIVGVAKALIRLGYTGQRRIAVLGTSAGAQMPGLAVAADPELFGAAIFDVGQSDEVRGAQRDPTAARNLAEMGDIDTPEGVRRLMNVSPYHRVPVSAQLPGMIVKSAADDYNFGGSITDAKYVARLQAANSGDRPIVWLNVGGGHSSILGSDPDIAAQAIAFMLWQVGHPAFQPKS